MKMTRSKLKGIVKECLVEILSEGIGGSSGHSLEISREEKLKNKRASLEAENRRLEEHRRSLDNKIETTVASLTNDSIMQEILADTARTTLQEQSSADRRPGHPDVSSPGINLDSIFSESAQNWSQLAFADKQRS